MFNKKILTSFLLGTLVLAVPTIAQADQIRSERVQFESGSASKSIEGQIKGYEVVDYVLNARKGQYANISMATQHGATYFNILAPGENNVAMFIGSTSGNQYEGTLPKSGDYKVRVYMMRSAARRDEVANYRLEMIITNDTLSTDAANTEKMLTSCKGLAAKEYSTGTSKIVVKYEGQRTDGTHVVNGTYDTPKVKYTFQCSFNRSGTQVVDFIQNLPESKVDEGAL